MGVCEDRVLAGTMRLKEDYKDPGIQPKNTDMQPKINKSDMAGMMKAIKEYLRSSHGVIRAPLAYIVRKTVILNTCRNYAKCVTPDEMIARMLHLLPDKNKLNNEQSVQ